MPHFTHEQQLEIEKGNIFPDSEIGDFNEHGFDSVPSEDFDPGFGCVPAKKPAVVAGPPELTPEIIKSLAEKEPTTTLGRMWQHIYQEQLKSIL